MRTNTARPPQPDPDPPPDFPSKWQLYEVAVQDPVAQARVLRHVHQSILGEVPTHLREDFAGLASDSIAWIQLDPTHRAVAVELDPELVRRGRERATRILGRRAPHLDFIQSSVQALDAGRAAPADIVCALNFSIGYLRRRKELTTYLAGACKVLDKGGIFVANAFGGPANLQPRTVTHSIPARKARRESPALPAFLYHWEIRRHNPVNQLGEFRIHFEIPSASGASPRHLRDAFIYRWRLWSLPELTEALLDAGFDRAEVWRHSLEPSADGPRVSIGPVRSLARLEAWVVYVVGIREARRKRG